MKCLAILLLLSSNTLAVSEADWVNATCEGIIEYRLNDKTRVDCLTQTHAIEYDWQHKWAEAIGQSLHYALKTGKQAGIRLICKDANCQKYANRIIAIAKHNKLKINIQLIKPN